MFMTSSSTSRSRLLQFTYLQVHPTQVTYEFMERSLFQLMTTPHHTTPHHTTPHHPPPPPPPPPLTLLLYTLYPSLREAYITTSIRMSVFHVSSYSSCMWNHILYMKMSSHIAFNPPPSAYRRVDYSVYVYAIFENCRQSYLDKRGLDERNVDERDFAQNRNVA
jgi:hypothetical protein